MNRLQSGLLVVSVLLVATLPVGAQDVTEGRVRLRLDTAEATAVLRILDLEREGRPGSPADWQRLFDTEGYQRLKAREAAMRRPFEDDEFVAFVRSDSLQGRLARLREALAAWSAADLQAAAHRALAYLPPDARIEATVYVVIKPRTNSFVWEVTTRPAIFLYLDPDVTAAQFANTVAHELHHIGFSSVQPRADSIVASLPDSVRPAASWMGAFGEGFAMLAAAGGPGVHPHADSPPEERARWDRDVANFNRDLGKLDAFFLDVIAGRLGTADSIRTVAFTFFGVQGPWYTVGWTMAVAIEERFGRAELIRCMTDPRRLLARYNAAVADSSPNARARWSPELLGAMKVVPIHD